MPEWIKVASEEDFSKKVVMIEHDDQRIAVFKLADGYYAIADECSHAEASLSEGNIVNECEVECPLHGAKFDIKTGKNLSFPAVVPVEAFQTRVENGIVYVGIDD